MLLLPALESARTSNMTQRMIGRRANNMLAGNMLAGLFLRAHLNRGREILNLDLQRVGFYLEPA